MKTLIIIPARYGSTRLPAKPLLQIAGRSLVSRVADVAVAACGQIAEADYVVAVDDARVEDHCREHGLKTVMTDPDCPSGSDRALAAVEALGAVPEVVVNLQGDAPFTPVAHVVSVATACAETGVDCATPVVQLSWSALDELKKHKLAAPFSGTTCIRDPDGRALWFSKNILPAMRKEDALRAAGPLSPVLRHIGLYAYRLDALKRFAGMKPSRYEELEGLEQLRLLEAGMHVKAVVVDAPEISMAGIDQPEDVALAERLLAQKAGA